MKPEQLLEWKNTLELEIGKLRSQAQDVAAEIQKKSHQLDLVEKLIASHDSSVELVAKETPNSNENDQIGQNAVSSAGQAVSPAEVKDHVYQILSDANRPMNINEIHAEFVRRGYAIPGKGTSFNILVHISRETKNVKSGRFVWAARGTYALRETASKKKAGKTSAAV